MNTQCFHLSRFSQEALEALKPHASRINDTLICFDSTGYTQVRPLILATDTAVIKKILHKMQLGHAIHEITSALRIPHCPGCSKRERILNGSDLSFEDEGETEDLDNTQED